DSIFPMLASWTAPRAITQKKFNGSATYSANSAAGAVPAPVRVVELKRVAGLDAAVLEASSPEALNEWLKEHQYQSSPGLVDWLKPYVERKWFITAFKFAKQDSQSSALHASAVCMSFQTSKPFYPYREPAEPRATSYDPPRLLRLYFLGPDRVSGTREEGG